MWHDIVSYSTIITTVIMCLLCICYEYDYLFLSHYNLILCILYKCYMGCIKRMFYMSVTLSQVVTTTKVEALLSIP